MKSHTHRDTHSCLRHEAYGGKMRLRRHVVVSQPISRLSRPIMNCSCSHGTGVAAGARNRDIPRRRRTGVTLEYAVLHGTCTLLAGLPGRGKAEQTIWGLNGSSCVSRSRQLTWSCEGPPRYHLELGLFHLLELPSCIRLAYNVPRYKKHHDCDLSAFGY